MLTLGALACGGGGAKRNTDPFCATRPQLELCEDFDELPLPGAFERQDVRGARFQIEDDALSPPHALNVKFEAGAGLSHAVLERTFAYGPKTRVLAQVRLDEISIDNVEMLAINLGDYHIAVVGKPDGSLEGLVRATTGDTRMPGTAGIPVGEWTSLRLNVDLDGVGGGKMTIFVGEDAVVGPVAITPPAGEIGARLAVGLAGERPGAGPWQMRYDNITFTRL